MKFAKTSPNLTIRMGFGRVTKANKRVDEFWNRCFTLITLDFYAFYASTFLSCNENDFRQRLPVNKRKTLVISLSAHVITALVRWSVRRSVSEAVINVRALLAHRIKNIYFAAKVPLTCQPQARNVKGKQVKRKHACSFN